jgi:hypothetical protein
MWVMQLEIHQTPNDTAAIRAAVHVVTKEHEIAVGDGAVSEHLVQTV